MTRMLNLVTSIVEKHIRKISFAHHFFWNLPCEDSIQKWPEDHRISIVDARTKEVDDNTNEKKYAITKVLFHERFCLGFSRWRAVERLHVSLLSRPDKAFAFVRFNFTYSMSFMYSGSFLSGFLIYSYKLPLFHKQKEIIS